MHRFDPPRVIRIPLDFAAQAVDAIGARMVGERDVLGPDAEQDIAGGGAIGRLAVSLVQGE